MKNTNAMPNGEYCLYLRKSRADLDAEARGEGETLAKHKKMLLALAKKLKINITHIYQEVLSGDRLSDRPEALKLLTDVEEGKWKGVLVVEVERLARGDTIDQGMVAQAFKRSSTLIVTLNKTYDPNNEYDEEYFEFGLFMSRREYKTIKRRLQRGRENSAGDGNYIGARPPYGYQLAYDDKGERYLEPHPEQADVIKMIFDWYVNGIMEDGKLIDMGGVKIARRLQTMGIPTYKQTSEWNFNVILQMLRNEVYVGRIQWKKRSRSKHADPDKKYLYQTQDKEDWINVDGKHKALVDNEIFDQAQLKLKENMSNPVKDAYTVVNPFARLLFCGKCGKSMVLKPFPKHRKSAGYSIMCNNKYCDCKGSNFDSVEHRILATIDELLKQYKSSGKRKARSDSAVLVQENLAKALQVELVTLEAQKGTLFDYLERKIYTEEVFLERSRNLSERIQETQDKLKLAESQLVEERKKDRTQKDIIPTMQESLRLYKMSSDQQRKNTLMKSILSRIEYVKEKDQKGDDFVIRLAPRHL